MGKVLLALLVGLVGALIVHIGVVFMMPRVAEDNAFARLSRLMAPFEPAVVSEGGISPAQTGVQQGARPFGYLDPAFITAACRFTLSRGPVRLTAESGAGFWSASIHARSGDNLYSINQRLALDGRFDLVVGTPSQFEAARLEGVIGNGDSIPVVVQASELYLTLRGLVDEESLRPFVDRFVRSLRCEPIELSASAEGSSGSAG